MNFIFPLVLVAAVYFLMLRPQQQRVARQRSLIADIDVGDEVVTAGGIIGVVRRLDDERIWLEIAPTVEITLLRGAIAQRVTPPASDSGDLDSDDLDDDIDRDLDDRDLDRPMGSEERDEGFSGL
ncbi:MAG: preprotein translocase subunit YajC [Actinobacteria bacterium]|nr:preprotein translocase subunit YajC [Actinomycetota bacterium]